MILLPAMGGALLIHSVHVSELLQVRLQLLPRYRSLYRTPANAKTRTAVRDFITRVIDLIEL
jgi:hypothetical protein